MSVTAIAKQGYGEYLIQGPGEEPLPEDLFLRIYQAIQRYSPKVVALEPLSEEEEGCDRIDLIQRQIEKIAGGVKLVFLPRTLYELIVQSMENEIEEHEPSPEDDSSTLSLTAQMQSFAYEVNQHALKLLGPAVEGGASVETLQHLAVALFPSEELFYRLQRVDWTSIDTEKARHLIYNAVAFECLPGMEKKILLHRGCQAKDDDIEDRSSTPRRIHSVAYGEGWLSAAACEHSRGGAAAWHYANKHPNALVIAVSHSDLRTVLFPFYIPRHGGLSSAISHACQHGERFHPFTKIPDLLAQKPGYNSKRYRGWVGPMSYQGTPDELRAAWRPYHESARDLNARPFGVPNPKILQPFLNLVKRFVKH